MTHDEALDVRITRLDTFGHGKTIFGNKELIVYGALPSEYVRVSSPRKDRKRSRCLWATIDQVLEASPDRVVPKCPYAGSCGGCLLQHLSYEKQLEWKHTRILDLFSPYIDKETEICSAHASPETWFYRNKMEYSFSQDSAGKRFLGLFSLIGKRKVEKLSSCEIGPLWGTEALQSIFAWWEKSGLQAYNPMKDTGTLRTVTFRFSQRTKSMMVILTVSGRPEWAPNKKDLASFVEALLPLEQKYESHLSCIVRIHQSIKGYPTNFYELVLKGAGVFKERYSIRPSLNSPLVEHEFQFSPSSFCQPNTIQAEYIYSRALQMLDLKTEDIVWDFFCGVGGFGLAAAPFVKKVVGIELSPDSAFDATCNKETSLASNFIVERSDVFDIVRSAEAMERLSPPNKCVIDPPRSGIGDKVINLIHSLPLERLVYVSCNPVSQQKDMVLFHSLGWKIRKMQPVDQFPHTPHMENVILLIRDFSQNGVT